jgi:hypothetical protein
MEQTIDYRGYKIEIVRDVYAENPRELDDCSVGKLFTAHRKYQPQYNFRDMFSPEEVWDQNNNIKASFLKDYYAANVYLLDHSGLRVGLTPFSNRWDSGLFGIICCLKRDAKCFDFCKDLTDAEIEEKIMYYFKQEIKTLDDYYAGDVYGVRIFDDSEDEEEVDSSWGFYGDEVIPDAIEDAKCTIDKLIKLRFNIRERMNSQLQLNFNS